MRAEAEEYAATSDNSRVFIWKWPFARLPDRRLQISSAKSTLKHPSCIITDASISSVPTRDLDVESGNAFCMRTSPHAQAGENMGTAHNRTRACSGTGPARERGQVAMTRGKRHLGGDTWEGTGHARERGQVAMTRGKRHLGGDRSWFGGPVSWSKAD
jgi:hypothetical protein